MVTGIGAIAIGTAMRIEGETTVIIALTMITMTIMEITADGPNIAPLAVGLSYIGNRDE